MLIILFGASRRRRWLTVAVITVAEIGGQAAPLGHPAGAGLGGWLTQATRITRQSWRGMLGPLLRGAVLPALPAAGCILAATVFAEAHVTNGNGAGWAGPVAVIAFVLLIPLTVCGGYWVASSFARAARAARATGEAALTGRPGPGQPASDWPGTGQPVSVPREPETPRVGRMWGAYLAGVACLMAAAAAATYLITDNMAPVDLGFVTVAGFVLMFAARGQSQPRPAAGRAGGLAVVVTIATGYSLALGYLMYGLTDLLQATGLVIVVAILANLLTLPLLIFLLSAGLASRPDFSARSAA
jgi:hypothetical protein